MKVIIRHSEFYSENKYDRIQGIIDYINDLKVGMYRDEELDQQIPQAQEVYFVDYYLCQVENGGIKQYFINSDFNEAQNIFVTKGLKNIGAIKHQEIFQEACDMLLSLTKEQREECLSFGWHDQEGVKSKSIISDANRKLEELTKAFFELENKESIIDLNHQYIETIRSLQIVEEDSYNDKISEILSLISDYDERKLLAEKMWEAERPRYDKVAHEICEQYNLELISINTLDYGEDIVSENEVEKIILMR